MPCSIFQILLHLWKSLQHLVTFCVSSYVIYQLVHAYIHGCIQPAANTRFFVGSILTCSLSGICDTFNG